MTSPLNSEADPEKLLRSLDWELGALRQQRVGGGNRQLFRVLSLAVIIGSALLALYILSQMLESMPRPAHAEAPAAAAESPLP